MTDKTDKTLYLAILVEAPSAPPSYHLLDGCAWAELDFDHAARQIRKGEVQVLQSCDSTAELNTFLAASSAEIVEERGFTD